MYLDADYTKPIIIAALALQGACGIFSAILADEKGRDGMWWLAWGCLFGPLALFTIGMIGRLTPSVNEAYLTNLLLARLPAPAPTKSAYEERLEASSW